MPVAALVPAYNPDFKLVQLVVRLSQEPRIARIIVVDDGSRDDCRAIFEHLAIAPRVVVLRHAVNLGKGAALKTGLNYFLCDCPELTGVVTADADGQHLPQDILAVAQDLEDHPDRLVLGARQFEADVPLRSRFGNTLTRYIFWGLVGAKLADTQTGLRGIPCHFVPTLLKIKSDGYEFELEMLLGAKHLGIGFEERPISTVYLDHNASSHFNPLWDSLKIYFVLLRFMMASLITTAVGYVTFFLVYLAGGGILAGEACSRVVGTGMNFLLAKNVVFRSRARDSRALPKFILLVVLMGTISYTLIQAIISSLGWHVMLAKVSAELLVYFANFAIQRDFIFGSPPAASVLVRTASDEVGTDLRRAA